MERTSLILVKNKTKKTCKNEISTNCNVIDMTVVKKVVGKVPDKMKTAIIPR